MEDSLLKHSAERWEQFFMALAVQAGAMSKDPDRKVGALLVTPDRRQFSLGYNGFPPEVPDTAAHLYDKAFKLKHMVHAEDNCIRQAPFNASGCSLFVTRFPCRGCAEKIAAAGIAQVVAPRPDFGHLRWGNSWMQGLGVLLRARIDVVYFDMERLG